MNCTHKYGVMWVMATKDGNILFKECRYCHDRTQEKEHGQKA